MDTAFLTRLLQYYKFHVQIDLEDDDSYTAYPRVNTSDQRS